MSEENVSLPVAQALASALEKIEAYVPTEYVDNSEPDIDAEHLNHAELGIMRVTNLLNAAVDVIQGQESRLADAETKIGTAALTGGMTDLSSGLNTLNSNLINISTDQNYIAINEGFVATGHFQVCLINKAFISISINVKTTKSSTDWIFNLKDGYRPQYKFPFSYYLGEKEYSGHIDEAGNVFFSTLNTTDILSCSLCFPIA